MPLSHLRGHRSRVRASVIVRGLTRSEDAFLFERTLIWGATGRILHNFLAVIGREENGSP